jgi:hypothetical protein
MKTYLYLIIPCLYLSTNNLIAQTNERTAFIQAVDVKPYAGLDFKMSAAVRVVSEETTASAVLWIRVDKKDKSVDLFDNMHNRKIQSADWQVYTIEGKLNADADTLRFGGIAAGNGDFYFDDFQFNVFEDGIWKVVPVKNANFEELPTSSEQLSGWRVLNEHATNFQAQITEKAHSGKQALQIRGKGYFNVPDLLEKYVGTWEIKFIEDSSKNVPEGYDMVGEYTYTLLEGEHVLKEEWTGTITRAGKMFDINSHAQYSYHPDLQKLYYIVYGREFHPLIASGSLETTGNIYLRSLLGVDQKEEETVIMEIIWKNADEIECIVQQRTIQNEMGKYYYQFRRK